MNMVHASSASKPSRSLTKRVALSSVVFTAATLATLGLYGHHATTFHHDTTRLLAEIASAKGIEVSLRDVQGVQIHGMLLPKAAASTNDIAFDGRISYELTGSQYNFTLLNDRAYLTVEDMKTGKLTRSGCIHPENVPPIATLTDALHNARVIDAVAGKNVTCASGKMIEFNFAGEQYVMCKNAESADGPGTVSVHGDDLQASLKLLSENSQGIPSLASLAPPAGLDMSKCGAITPTSGDKDLVAPKPAASATRLLQRTQDAFTVATGGRRLSKMATECGCSGGMKKCLFVHGLGYSAGPTTSSFKEYFGTIEEQAKCCSQVKFLHVDTLNAPWWDEASTDAVCKEAMAMGGAKSNSTAIENVAIVAHSMGNLIVTAAFMQKKCKLAKSSKYIALAGPMYGSASASSGLATINALPKSVVDRLCTSSPNTVIEDKIVNALMFFGLCPTRISISSIVFRGSKVSTPDLDALLTAVGDQFGKSVTSSLCGVSFVGLQSTDRLQLTPLGQLSGHASLFNDGQVEFDSCHATVPKSNYKESWDGGNFYRAGINHLDATFRNGDGWWGNDRKPIKWFNCQF